MKIKLDQKTREYVRQAQQAGTEIVTEADLAPLPAPVQRYLRYAQIVGKPRTRCATARQTGVIRFGPAQRWLPVEAVQITTLAGTLSRTWHARVKAGPIALFSGYDRYDAGVGRMLIRLLSIYPVVNMSGPELDMSALIIFINDMVMWPAAFLSDYIHWEPLDPLAATARVTLHGKEFSAKLRFGETGELVDFVTEDRYRAVGKGYDRPRWSTPFRRYREVNGLRVPTEGDAIWHLPEGDFRYIQVTFDEVQYDTFDFD